VRVYLPTTFGLLGRWLAAGEATPLDYGRGATAYAVTPALREWYREADLDELEHVAQRDAALDSLQLLAADGTTARRRVVLSLDVADQQVRPDAGRGRAAVVLTGGLQLTGWASALADLPDAEAAVVQAIASLDRAAAGDEDAQFAIDEAEAHELGWYAVQELPQLLG
jgi:hypothetical protein